MTRSSGYVMDLLVIIVTVILVILYITVLMVVITYFSQTSCVLVDWKHKTGHEVFQLLFILQQSWNSSASQLPPFTGDKAFKHTNRAMDTVVTIVLSHNDTSKVAVGGGEGHMDTKISPNSRLGIIRRIKQNQNNS